MDEVEIDRWFSRYLTEFGAAGRGEVEDVQRLVEFYGVPLLVGTDAGCPSLGDEERFPASPRQRVPGCARRATPAVTS